MKKDYREIRIIAAQYSPETYQQYIMSPEKIQELDDFILSEFMDLENLRIHSSKTETALLFCSTLTSIADVWTALHLFLQIPYINSARFPLVTNSEKCLMSDLN